MNSAVKHRNTTEDDITAEVLRRYDATQDPRLRQIMQSLTRHLHAFVKDVQLTEAEWMTAIQFLTETGHTCSEIRQEFILLSDTLGVSMVVDLINHRRPEGATETTVLGPFHRQDSPELPLGSDIGAKDKTGMPTYVSGRVLDLNGSPIAGAVLDIWQTASNGFYDSQDPALDGGINMRGIFRSDKDGRYFFWTTRPLHYSIPTDGPVGKMLRATNRHPFRPAHIHYIVTADGYRTVTTHVFDSEDRHLNDDTVFAVKGSLIREFKRHDTHDKEAERLEKEPPFYTLEFDIVMDTVGTTSVAG